MILHAPRRPSDRAGRRSCSGHFGLLSGRSWHRGWTLAGLPMALLLALSALFVGGVAVSSTVAGAASSTPAFIQLASLVPPTTASEFGTVIATSSNGTTALVGDPTGGAGFTGAATVYTFANGSWSAGTALAPPASSSAFGSSVALSGAGTTALVGDPDGGAGGLGAATVYTFSGSSWSAGTALTVPATADVFGTSVALSNDGSTALVGDPEATDAIGSGAATVFTGTGWSTVVSLASPNTSRTFGASVALSSSGSTALVGDPTASSGAHGIAYSYSGSSWGTRSMLVQPSHAKAFATSVALSGTGTTALVGDPTGGAGGPALRRLRRSAPVHGGGLSRCPRRAPRPHSGLRWR